MKQTKFIFLVAAMVALSVGFSSCSNDDDNPLVGTTWVFTESGDDWSDTTTLRFTTETAGTVTSAWTDGEESGSRTAPFTYTFNAPTVTITISYDGGTEIVNGTVSGSRMTFTDEGGTQVFTRQ